MRLPLLQQPLQAACIHGGYRPVLASFALPIRTTLPTAQALRPVQGNNKIVDGRRYASVKSQGAYRIPNKKTIAKKLGAKKSGDQFVIPGNIIYKQRGTIWHAGENAIRGRDHTIHAAITGYVKYYRDPAVHPDRQFIGVAFNKEDSLPYPKSEPRRRKLGLVAHVRKVRETTRPAISDSGIPNKVLRKAGLWNVEALERRLWNADQRREVREAKEQRARDAKAGLAGLSVKAAAVPGAAAVSIAETSSHKSPEAVAVAPTVSAAATTTTTMGTEAISIAKSSDSTSPDDFAAAAVAASIPTRLTINSTTTTTTTPPPKTPFQRERTRPVTPGEFLQKSWQERRHTKVLLLNPRSYAYAESNAAIGRLSSKTMYRAPWELGGRKSRFRSRRRQAVAQLAKQKADKELVKREKARERAEAEEKRLAALEKQRVRSAKRAEAALAAEAAQAAKSAAGEAGGDADAGSEVPGSGAIQDGAQPAVEATQPVVAQEAVPSAEVKDAETPVVKDAEKPVVAAEGSQKPTDAKDGNKPSDS